MSKRAVQRLTLDLDGVLAAAQFSKGVNAFVDILDAATKDVAGSARAIRWIVSVEAGSSRVHALAESPAPNARVPQVATVVARGLKLIGRRPQRPKHFSDAALVAAHDLGEVGGELRAKVRAQGGTTPTAADISRKVAVNVEVLLGARFQDYGTIEGRLQTLSERGGLHFAVYDALTDKAVRCAVSADRMAEAWKAFGRRVAVSGPIHYRRDGHPISIDVEHLTIFPNERDLPTADDVYGLFGNLH